MFQLAKMPLKPHLAPHESWPASRKVVYFLRLIKVFTWNYLNYKKSGMIFMH